MITRKCTKIITPKKKSWKKSLHVQETVEMLCLIVLFTLSGFLLARDKNLINQSDGVKVSEQKAKKKKRYNSILKNNNNNKKKNISLYRRAG